LDESAGLVAASGWRWSLCCHYELSTGAVDREQMGYELPCYREGGTVGMPLLLLCVIDERQIGAESWPELGGFDQHTLKMLVPLLADASA
jgi:hypothetical protein